MKLNHSVIKPSIVVGFIICACNVFSPTIQPIDTHTPTLVDAASPTAQTPPARGELCGDGVCDQNEIQNPVLCPQDCEPAQSPASSPLPGRGCGDGICDGPENTESCPQDCNAASPPASEAVQPPTTGEPAYEPPINIFFVLHIDPSMELGAPTFQADPKIYQRTRDEIIWLMDEAKRHNLPLTILFNGWYTKWALDHNDLDQFSQLLEAGHELGTHAHSMTYDPQQDLWLSWGEQVRRYGNPVYDASLALQARADADHYMDAVLEAIDESGRNQTMCAAPFKCSDEGLMMNEFDFTFASGNRSEKGPFYFGHIVWNPWRPAASDQLGYELDEDLKADFVAVDHYAQIGAAQEAHAGIDVSPAALKRNFLMLYTEWLSRERRGVQDKVWVFGFNTHPNYADKYNADISDFLSWLDQHFIEKTSLHGHTIARYATVSDIGQQYLDWEKKYPGVSSFRFVKEDPYPYTYAILPEKLENATYVTHLDLEQGLTGFKLSKDGRPIYLLWSDQGERNLDLSTEQAGQVNLTFSNGDQSVVDASQIPLSEEPLIVETLQ